MEPEPQKLNRQPIKRRTSARGSQYESGQGATASNRKGKGISNNGAGSSRRGSKVAIALLAAAGIFGMTRGEKAYAGTDDQQAPNYDKHQTAVAGATLVALPDKKLTKEIRKAALTGADLMIPGSPIIPPSLVPSLAKENVTWYRVSFYDTCAEDGDWVSVTLSNGMVFPRFPLLHASHQIAIPVTDGLAPTATIVAEIDGVGGVTVGAVTDDGVWYSSVLPVGGTQVIPIRVR